MSATGRVSSVSSGFRLRCPAGVFAFEQTRDLFQACRQRDVHDHPTAGGQTPRSVVPLWQAGSPVRFWTASTREHVGVILAAESPRFGL
jgi:hypothetical protein